MFWVFPRNLSRYSKNIPIPKPSACLCFLLALLFSGCADRKLSWHYVERAREQIAGAQRVTFVSRVAPANKIPAGSADLAGAITGELLDRNYRVTTQESGADLFLEFSAQVSQQTVTSTTTLPIPFMTKSRTKSEVRNQIHRITLNVILPQDQTIVGMVTVEYSKPRDKVQDAVKDALLGLDMIRRGSLPSTVNLSGKPGQPP